jgi:hypothetical protein
MACNFRPSSSPHHKTKLPKFSKQLTKIFIWREIQFLFFSSSFFSTKTIMTFKLWGVGGGKRKIFRTAMRRVEKTFSSIQDHFSWAVTPFQFVANQTLFRGEAQKWVKLESITRGRNFLPSHHKTLLPMLHVCERLLNCFQFTISRWRNVNSIKIFHFHSRERTNVHVYIIKRIYGSNKFSTYSHYRKTSRESHCCHVC